MRMCIGFIRHAVCRPTRVRNPCASSGRVLVQSVLQFLHLADSAQAINTTTGLNGEPGRVIASVLEPTQAFHQDWNNISLSDSADDSTHLVFSQAQVLYAPVIITEPLSKHSFIVAAFATIQSASVRKNEQLAPNHGALG